MSYYVAKVKVVISNDNGKQKKNVEQYLVNAVSVTDAESKIHEEFKNDSLDFEVTSVVETKIIKVINQEGLMNYTTGSMIIISAFKKFKVGEVVDKVNSKNGILYTIKSEDGKVYGNVLVDAKKNNIFIHSNLTDSFLKSKDNGHK